MKARGWEAYVQYKKFVQSQAKYVAKVDEMPINGNIRDKAQELFLRERGFLIDCFKLYLYDQTLMDEDLPKCLSPKQANSDFLGGMAAHFLSELRQRQERNAVYKRDIKWSFTVPAIWEESHRKQMEECAEMAGHGPSCRDETASLHDLIIVLEPEAACIYCHNTLKLFHTGDTFAIVDLGRGTTDVVTHESIGSTARSNVRVKEVAETIGWLCVGVYLDLRFLNYLRQTIRTRTPTCRCFREFEKLYPSQVLEMLIDWARIKAIYDGAVDELSAYEPRCFSYLG